jgi:hypothetical protein
MKMSNFTKKIALILLSSLLIFNSVMAAPLAALAADEAPSTWYNQGFTDWYAKVYGDESPPSEIFGERYTAAQVQWIIYGLVSMPINFLGKDNQALTSCVVSIVGSSTDLKACWDAYWQTTWLSKMLELLPFNKIALNNNQTPLAMVFDTSNREVSGIKYTKDLLTNFGIVTTVNAQEGFGYGKLGLMQPFWQVTRNLAYTLIVLFVIVFAFMIMFRVKISPQVVISIQSALPKVFLALVLATFSYAIAGFVIDLMYVVIGIIAGFWSQGGWFPGVQFNFIYSWITASVAGVPIPDLAVFTYMLVYTALFFVLVLFSLIASSVGLINSGFSILLSFILLLLVIWLLVLCFWFLIKIPWMLIKTLINIYLSVIIAPIQIVFGAIAPQMGFGLWIKNLIANVMVFPFVGTMFLLAYMFLFYGYVALGETIIEHNILSEIATFLGFKIDGFLPGTLWSPPFLGSGAEITPLIFALMSFGIIVAIPKASDILKMLIMGAKFDYGTAIGEAVGAFGILPMAQKAGGQFVSDKLYNPKDNKGAIPTLWSKYGPNKAKSGTPQSTGPVNTPS